MRFKLSTSMKKYIDDHYQLQSRGTMSKHLGCSKTPINTYMNKIGLSVSKEQSYKWSGEAQRLVTNFTIKEDAYIKKYYLKKPVKVIGRELGRSGGGIKHRIYSLGLVLPLELIAKRKKQSYYQKGSIPMNKGKKQTEYMSPQGIKNSKATRFKKGDKPVNIKRIGSITIRSNYRKENYPSYKWIKIGENEWMMLHLYNWIKKHGDITKDHIITFINKDTMNCDPENLRMTTVEEHMLRNSVHDIPEELIPSLALISRINNKLKKLKDGTK